MAQRQHRKHHKDGNVYFAPLGHCTQGHGVPKHRTLDLGLGQAPERKALTLALHMQGLDFADAYVDDVIIGNSQNNLITFKGGNDIVDGQEGIDSIRLWYFCRKN